MLQVSRHSTTKKAILDFAINPLEEVIAYETLLALNGATEVKLAKEFPSNELIPNTRPSKILELKKQNGQKVEIEKIYPRVETLINSPPQKNLWVPGGSGSFPRL